MAAKGMRTRLLRGLRSTAVVAATLAAGVAVAPAAAQAADNCISGYYCYYRLDNQTGTRGTIYYYTSGWTRLPSLVDDTWSGMDAQTGSSCAVTLHPFFYMSDTYQSQRWTRLVGSRTGERRSYNNLPGSDGLTNFRDKFNDYWNACR